MLYGNSNNTENRPLCSFVTHLMYPYARGVLEPTAEEIAHLKQIYDLYYTGD